MIPEGYKYSMLSKGVTGSSRCGGKIRKLISHLEPQAWSKLEIAWIFKLSKPTSWHTSSNKTALLKRPPNNATKWWPRVQMHELWGTFSFKPPHSPQFLSIMVFYHSKLGHLDSGRVAVLQEFNAVGIFVTHNWEDREDERTYARKQASTYISKRWLDHDGSRNGENPELKMN